MTYNDFITRLAIALEIDNPAETNFVAYLPELIQDAENRIYRDLDPLVMRKTGTGTVAAAATTITVPADWLIGQELYFTSGAGVTAGARRADQTFLMAYGNVAGTPRYWSQPTFGSVQFAPPADATYAWTAYYTYQPAALSVSNTVTWITTNIPDLFFAAAMAGGAAYQKNFGAQSDDPRMAMSWENTYQALLHSARLAEGRRKGDGYFDASQSQPPTGDAPRGGE
jgi:hypothetical protein